MPTLSSGRIASGTGKVTFAVAPANSAGSGAASTGTFEQSASGVVSPGTYTSPVLIVDAEGRITIAPVN